MPFSNVEFLGNILIDNVKCIVNQLTVSQINSIPNTQQLRDVSTIMLGDFENSLDVGNISSGGNVLTGWRIKRKNVNDSVFTNIKDLPKNTITFKDYTTRNNQTYIYSVYTLSANGESLGVPTDIVVSDFYGWVLTDGTISYLFDAGFDGIKTDSINVNKDVHVYENYTKYPTISFGARQYKTSKITTVPYKLIDNDFIVDVDLLNGVEAFIDNGNPKILKSPSGEIMYIATSGFSYQYQDKIGLNPFEISFNWTEVGDGTVAVL